MLSSARVVLAGGAAIKFLLRASFTISRLLSKGSPCSTCGTSAQIVFTQAFLSLQSNLSQPPRTPVTHPQPLHCPDSGSIITFCPVTEKLVSPASSLATPESTPVSVFSISSIGMEANLTNAKSLQPTLRQSLAWPNVEVMWPIPASAKFAESRNIVKRMIMIISIAASNMKFLNFFLDIFFGFAILNIQIASALLHRKVEEQENSR